MIKREVYVFNVHVSCVNAVVDILNKSSIRVLSLDEKGGILDYKIVRLSKKILWTKLIKMLGIYADKISQVSGKGNSKSKQAINLSDASEDKPYELEQKMKHKQNKSIMFLTNKIIKLGLLEEAYNLKCLIKKSEQEYILQDKDYLVLELKIKKAELEYNLSHIKYQLEKTKEMLIKMLSKYNSGN